VVALFQLLDKERNAFNAVLVISVNGQDSCISSFQSIPQSHPELGSLLAGASFHQEGVHAPVLQSLGLHTAVGAAPITEDNIHQGIYPGGLGPVQFLENPLSLIDNGDEQTVFGFLFSKLRTGKIRYALQSGILHLIQTPLSDRSGS